MRKQQLSDARAMLARMKIGVRTGVAFATLWLSFASAAAQDEAAPVQPLPASIPSAASSETVLQPAAASDLQRAQRMQAWLEYLSRAGSTVRITNGLANSLSAAFFGAVGVSAIASNNDDESSSTRFTGNVLGATFLGVTAGYVYGAISDFVSDSTDEQRLASWRELGGSVDAQTLARFEGELAAEAEIARKAQLYSVGSSIGLTATGGLLLGLVPATDLSGSDRTLSYVVGGGLLVVGAAGIVVSLLTESHKVRAYRLYREGKAPDGDGDGDDARLRMTPVLGARDVGLMLSGRF